MFKAKDELQELEIKYKTFEEATHKISFKDIDALLRKLGATMHKRDIEVITFSS
jgi:hypothetical protein